MNLRAALLFVSVGCAGLAQDGSRDPVFAAVPFNQWLAGSEPPRIHWSTRVLPAELSKFQRLQTRVDLDWRTLEAGFKEADPKMVDVRSLKKRGDSAQLLVKQVGQRIADAGEPVPVVIVLTGTMAFDSGENPHAVAGAKPAGKLFYIRYHAPVPKPGFPGAPKPAPSEPIDELERIVKPLDPRVFDVYTPEQFRKALSTLIQEISRL